MSQASRKLQVGDYATTDYNARTPDRVTDAPGRRVGAVSTEALGILTRVQITAVDRERKHGHSQSGVMFKVTPMLKHGTPDTWYCADWFEPVAQKCA